MFTPLRIVLVCLFAGVGVCLVGASHYGSAMSVDAPLFAGTTCDSSLAATTGPVAKVCEREQAQDRAAERQVAHDRTWRDGLYVGAGVIGGLGLVLLGLAWAQRNPRPGPFRGQDGGRVVELSRSDSIRRRTERG